MASYIERTNVDNVKATISQHEMLTRFKNMLGNVTTMLEKEGPIYSTWIKFQIGASDSEAIIFDSSSTNPKKNLIAKLDIQKNGSGVANSFTLIVQYDPFNYGQEQADVIEKLDEYVAKAMSVDYNTETKTLLGYLQYGYNAVSDSSLVSPKYAFYLTNATTEVRFDSGISTYTFTGTSILSVDCDNVNKFPMVTKKNMLGLVLSTLYYWYGDPDNPPQAKYKGELVIGEIEPKPNDYKYQIDVPDDLVEISAVIEKEEAMSGITPWEYCQHLLSKYPLTTAEEDSELYENWESLSYAQRPRYVMYVDDATKTIRVTHVVPKVTTDDDGNTTKISEDSYLSLDYTFSWSQQSQNLVVGWKPEVSTMIYLIRKARYDRAKDELEAAKNGGDDKAIKAAQEKLDAINDDLNEIYDAQLQIVGIPADPPIGLTIGIRPIILETESRTSGIYMISSSADSISSNGVYLTTLTLTRIRPLDAKTITLEAPKEPEINNQAQEDNKASSNENDDNEEGLKISITEIDVPGRPSGGNYA